jgi:flagellar protein FliJ
MPRFRFRLEKILRLRKHDEDQSSRELALLLGKKAELQLKIEAQKEQRGSLLKRRFDIQIGEVDVQIVAANGSQIELTRRVEADLQSRIFALEPEITRKREELLEKSRRRKALDKLKQRQQGEHKVEENRRELREADERPHRPRVA